MKRMRVAIVGGVGIWGRYYLRAYHLHPECEIVALVDTARERRQEFAVRYGISRVYDRVEDLLADEVPDIVAASVPVKANAPIVHASIDAGVKVVSCEKPIAANLAEADRMVDHASRAGVSFACGTALYEVPFMSEIATWAADTIAPFTAAVIPAGIREQVSGLGCVLFTFLRMITRAEVAWVQGATTPPEAAHMPEDCGAYGILGMSNGIECRLPSPDEPHVPAIPLSVEGANGRLWLTRPRPVLISGTGLWASPVFPDFMDRIGARQTKDMFIGLADDLVACARSGGEAPCSGHDYRQGLEIAVALKLSAANGGERVDLPLRERDIDLLPVPYRMHGGDVVGWSAINQTEPTPIE